MNNFRNLCLLIFTLLGTYTTGYSSCGIVGTDGGLCIDDGSMNFVEEEVYQWKFEFDYSAYEALLKFYKEDSIITGDYVDYKVAGLGFIPIITPVTPPTSTEVTYITTGLKVVLVLWKGTVINGVNAPDAVELFGYDDLGKAFTFQKTPGAPSNLSFVHMLSTPVSGSQVQLVNDPLVHATREFEIVFLSISDFEYLAKSDNFYTPARPADPSDPTKPHQGITIERAFNTIDPNNGPGGMTHYRTLLFKPLPDPQSMAYPSEASVAYRNGEYCPPYWVDPSEDQFCSGAKGKCFLEFMVKKQPVILTDTIIINEPGTGGPIFIDKIRWDWMAMIIAAILAIFFGGRAILRNQG